jgi:hypothetical protein
MISEVFSPMARDIVAVNAAGKVVDHLTQLDRLVAFGADD